MYNKPQIILVEIWCLSSGVVIFHYETLHTFNQPCSCSGHVQYPRVDTNKLYQLVIIYLFIMPDSTRELLPRFVSISSIYKSKVLLKQPFSVKSSSRAQSFQYILYKKKKETRQNISVITWSTYPLTRPADGLSLTMKIFHNLGT